MGIPWFNSGVPVMRGGVPVLCETCPCPKCPATLCDDYSSKVITQVAFAITIDDVITSYRGLSGEVYRYTFSGLSALNGTYLANRNSYPDCGWPPSVNTNLTVGFERWSTSDVDANGCPLEEASWQSESGGTLTGGVLSFNADPTDHVLWFDANDIGTHSLLLEITPTTHNRCGVSPLEAMVHHNLVLLCGDLTPDPVDTGEATSS